MYVYVSKQPIKPSIQPIYTSTEALAGPSQSCAKVYGGGKVYRKDLPILQVRCAIPEAERTLRPHATGTFIGVNRLFGGVRTSPHATGTEERRRNKEGRRIHRGCVCCMYSE